MVGDGEPPPRVIDKLVCGNRIESGEQTEVQCPVYFVSRKRVKGGRHSHTMRRINLIVNLVLDPDSPILIELIPGNVFRGHNSKCNHLR